MEERWDCSVNVRKTQFHVAARTCVVVQLVDKMKPVIFISKVSPQHVEKLFDSIGLGDVRQVCKRVPCLPDPAALNILVKLSFEEKRVCFPQTLRPVSSDCWTK